MTRDVVGFWCVNCAGVVLVSDAIGRIRIKCINCGAEYSCDHAEAGGKISYCGGGWVPAHKDQIYFR